MRELTFELEPAPPFRLDLTVWALRRRADNAIDRWDGHTYRRVLALDQTPVGVAVTQVAPAAHARLHVTATSAAPVPGLESAVTGALERLLGLRIDLADFYACAAADPRLGPLAERFRGLKPPRYASLFEALVNAIACQQVTLTLGVRLLTRLAEHYGPAIPNEDQPQHAFPRPADLAAATPEALRALSFSRQKARALLELAAALTTGRLNLDALATLDNAAAVEQLRALHGVGRWTAEYVLLRGLGRLGVFPGDDVGARNNLQRWLGLDGPLDYDGVRRALERWQPYAGLIYLHLLLDALAQTGLVQP